MDCMLTGGPLRNVRLMAVHDVLQCHLFLFSPGKHGWGKAMNRGFSSVSSAFSSHYDFKQINFFSSLFCDCSGLFCLFSCSQFPYYVDLSFCLTVFLYPAIHSPCVLIDADFILLDLASCQGGKLKGFLAHACPWLLRCYVCGRHRKGSEFKEFNM